MLNLLNLLVDLVHNDVLIGVIRDAVDGLKLRVESQTPDGIVFKAMDIRTTTPGFSVSHHVMIDGKLQSGGFSHVQKVGDMCEMVWRDFGQDVAKLIRFFDNNPELKKEVLRG
jgi:hypothetical protein